MSGPPFLFGLILSLCFHFKTECSTMMFDLVQKFILECLVSPPAAGQEEWRGFVPHEF